MILDFTNRALFDSLETRIALATVFRRYRPAIVLGLLGKTPLASPDHWQASQITDAAVFYSRLTKWDDRFERLAPHRINRLAYYSLLHSEFGSSGSNQFVVDISLTLETKMQAIRCYKTQFPPEKQHVLERTAVIAQAAGASAGFASGEVLTSTKAIGTTDLMNLLMGSGKSQPLNI
jgi:LmbE family N-acetylglucosaminyl deacetylase